MVNLIPPGWVLGDSVYSTNYFCSKTTIFTIFEDASKDASPTFYNCPSDIQCNDYRYRNGGIYLTGHFVSYQSTFDIHAATYGQGTFVASLNWDGGGHINDLPPGERGGWTFGGTTTSQYACIPKVALGNACDYDQAMTGRIFRAVTQVKSGTWGGLRQLYR